MMVITRHLTKEILQATGFVLLALVALFAFFDLVGQLGRIGSRYGLFRIVGCQGIGQAIVIPIIHKFEQQAAGELLVAHAAFEKLFSVNADLMQAQKRCLVHLASIVLLKERKTVLLS